MGLKARLQDLLRAIDPVAEPKQRAVTFELAMDAVWREVENSYGWPWRMLDLYLDPSGLIVLLTDSERLYRANVTVEDDGSVMLSAAEPVQIELTPIQRLSEANGAAVSIVRMADGRYRLFMQACTATINRDQEIDSTELFDNMVRYAEDTGVYPKIDFYHLGSTNPTLFEFGQCDFVAREGFVYLASGVLDPDHPLTELVVRSLQDSPGYWGTSIEYLPLRAERWQARATDDSVVRVYTDGFNTRIALLPEKSAASLFTSIDLQEIKRMNQKQRAALLQLFENDEDKLNAFLSGAAATNSAVADEGLVARSESDDDNAGEPAVDPEDAPVGAEDQADGNEAPVQRSVVIDDEAVAEIANAVLPALEKAGFAATLVERATAASADAFAKTIADLQASITEQFATLSTRLQALEEADETEQVVRAQDTRIADPLRVTYRPRVDRADSKAGEEDDPNAAADAVLSKLPAVF